MKHRFQVTPADNTSPSPVNVDDMFVLAVFGMVKLPNGGFRMKATKFLREVTGIGLYEAKNIVDYIADNGTISEHGVSLDRRGTISYLGTD